MPDTQNVIDVILTFFGNPGWLALFGASGVYLFFRCHGKKRIAFCLTIIFLFVFVLNDLVYEKVGELLAYDVFYRFIWIVPAVILMAVGITALITDRKNKGLSILLFGFTLWVFILFENTGMHTDMFREPANEYRLTDAAVELADVILEDYRGSGKISVAMPSQFVIQFRIYDGRFETAITRWAYLGGKSGYHGGTKDYEHVLMDLIYDNHRPTAEEFEQAAKGLGLDYIISYNWNMDEWYTEMYNCRDIYRAKNYTVYKYEGNDAS